MTVRALAGAVSWLALGNLMVRALSLLTMPLLTRWLSPQAYGEAALVGTVVSLAGVIALAGIDMSYMRHAFSSQLGTEAEVEAFCWRWALGSGFLVATVASLCWWMFLARWFGNAAPDLFAFVWGGVFVSILATMTTTRARLQGRYARLTTVQFVVGCATAATSLGIAYAWRQDAWPLLIAMLVSYFLPALLLGLPLRRLARPSGLSALQRRRLLGVGLAGVITAPAYWVLSSSDRWFLAAFMDSATVGIYSIGFTVGTVGMFISTAITGAWLPELARDEAHHGSEFYSRKQDMVLWLVAILLIVTVAVTAVGGDLIRGVADPRFRSAADIVPLLASGVFFYGCLHVGSAMLVLAGRLHWAAVAWVIAVVVSVGLNYWLVPAYGALGAALVQSVSFLLVMALVWSAVLRAEPLRLPAGRLALAGLLALLAAAGMHVQWASSAWLSMVMKVVPGLVFALVCLWVLAPRQAMTMVNQIRGRN